MQPADVRAHDGISLRGAAALARDLRARPGRRLCALVLLPWLWATQPAQAQSQTGEYLTVVVREGQLLRDIATEYLGDPDLWPQILEASGLDSPAGVRPGISLRIPKNQVSLATDALNQALLKIQEATELGAKVFAEDLIAEAISLHDDAKRLWRAGEWLRCRDLAHQARAAAERALDETRRRRDAPAPATLTSRSGRVETRRSEALEWANAPEGAKLVEQERLRTLSESSARVVFADDSQLQLGPNSQAVIQKMRMDLLNHHQEASVSLVEGDVYALLAGSPKRRPLDVKVPGVTTETASQDYWMSRKGGTTKIANYDETAMLVGSGGENVALGRNQGTVIRERAAPSDPRDLLQAPELLEPADDHVAAADAVVVRWRAVTRARGYQLEVARDAAFPGSTLTRTTAGAIEERLAALGEGAYYWRVAAVDEIGFPGARSAVRRFHVRPDRGKPYLAVRTPAERAVLRSSPAHVAGEVESGATLTVNGAAVTPGAGGAFATDLPLTPGLNALVLEVRDASGKLTRRRLEVIYMPDRRAVVDYEDALGETGLLRTGKRSFLTRRERFGLAGRTLPEALLEVTPAAGGAATRGASDATGAFRMDLSFAGEHGEFRLRVTAPSGHVTEESFAVTRDSEPPVLTVDPEPEAVTRDARLSLRGRVTEDARLTLNGEDVAVDGEAFAASLELSPGENRLELVARDRAGNESRWQRTVLVDREAPRLLDHAVTPRSAAHGETVEVTVRAADASGLRRTASFVLVLGSSTYAGTLLLDALSGTYRGSLTLPREARGAAALQSVVLEDYNGNQRTYTF